MSELGFWLRHLASGLRPAVYKMFIKMRIKCISLKLPEATFYTPVLVSELGFRLRHLASGLHHSVYQMFIKMHIRYISLRLLI